VRDRAARKEKSRGRLMATIDLSALPADEFVLHFGGRPNEVDAYTFSNSLIAIGEAIQELNRQLDPSHSIEIAIEAIGSGSFRAKLKTHVRSIAGLFKHPARDLLIAILAHFIVTKMTEEKISIIVQDETVIVERDGDRIIIPKQAVDAAQKLPQPEKVERHIARTFEILEDDPSVTEFGIGASMTERAPMILVPRAEFPRLAIIPEDTTEDEQRRHIDEKAKLVVLKAIFERSERRWQFVWNGIRISAPIRDKSFFDKLAAREYEFGQGDVLDVTLRIYQIQDEITGAFTNERYEIIEVHGLERRPRQSSLFTK